MRLLSKMSGYLGLASVAISTVVSAAPSTAEDIQAWLSKSEKAAYYAGEDGRSEARMMIVDGQGRKQVRQFTILRKDVQDNGDQKMLVFFSRPTDVKDMVFRVEKHAAVSQDDDRWLYLPALDLVKRISAGDKRTSFVGSHFFYEDVSGRAISEDRFELVEEDAQQLVLKGIPKNPDTVEFDHYLVTIDKRTSIPMKIDFYKASGELYRKVEAVKVEEIQGFPTVVRSKVTDVQSGGYTLMEFRQPQYNIGLPDDVFSERSLRSPPSQWLN